MRTRRALAISAVMAMAAANLLTACTPEDDDDVFATPTPSPTPAEVAPVHCQVVWANRTATEEIDVFVIDAPEESWTLAGTGTFDDFVGYYQPGVSFDPGNHAIGATLDDAGAMVATTASLAWSVTLNTTASGADLAFDDFTPKSLLALGTDGSATTAIFGSALAITFDGVWSTRDAGFPLSLDEDAEVLIALSGTSGDMLTIGDLGAYALCYELPAEE